jgi:hypothetical protein
LLGGFRPERNHINKHSFILYGIDVAIGVISDAVAEGITGIEVPIGRFFMYESLDQIVKNAKRIPKQMR